MRDVRERWWSKRLPPIKTMNTDVFLKVHFVIPSVTPEVPSQGVSRRKKSVLNTYESRSASKKTIEDLKSKNGYSALSGKINSRGREFVWEDGLKFVFLH